MKANVNLKALTLSLAFIFTTYLAHAQDIEFTLSYGITAVDIDELVLQDEVSGTYASDWGLGSGLIGARYLHPVSEQMYIGGELLYHHLFWYSVEVPYGNYTIYREYAVSGIKFTPYVRLKSRHMIYDIGPEINFMDGVFAGIYASVMYDISIKEGFSIPIGIRTDQMFGIVPYTFVGLNTGLKWTL